MRNSDLSKFNTAWIPAQELTGKNPSDGAVLLAFNLLKEYDIKDISQALVSHLTDPELGRFAPKPADVIYQIKKANHDGRLESDEAWSLCLSFFDDHQTVVINDEITESLKFAGDIYRAGDATAARLAFRATYAKVVQKNREIGKEVKWWPSLGTDLQIKKQVLQDAVASGQFTADYVNQILIDPIPDTAIAALIKSVPNLKAIGQK